MLEGIAPMGRLGSMEEIVSLVIYLASEEARFVTGSEIVIDGGSTAGTAGRLKRPVRVTRRATP
jgi:NAD(P)-dependent dehydrogenase (short-subunit alcohol dehydrogenase family)